MSRLQSILYHDQFDEGRQMEVQFSPDALFFSIEWEVGKGGLGGVRAESFTLNPDQAYYLAKDILEKYLNPMIIEDNLAAIS